MSQGRFVLFVAYVVRCIYSYFMKEDYEHTIKIMLVGDSGVGKTAFMNRFC